MDERMKKYEQLVQSTVRYWRSYITVHMDDEDIAQELRIQIWKSLKAYDPVKAKGYSEDRFVFWHVRNKIKDLVAKKHREYFETLVDSDDINDRNIIDYREKSNTDLISGLPSRQQEICILMLQGYNNTEVAEIIGIKTSTLRVEIGKIKHEMFVRLSASAVA